MNNLYYGQCIISFAVKLETVWSNSEFKLIVTFFFPPRFNDKNRYMVIKHWVELCDQIIYLMNQNDLQVSVL